MKIQDTKAGDEIEFVSDNHKMEYAKSHNYNTSLIKKCISDNGVFTIVNKLLGGGVSVKCRNRKASFNGCMSIDSDELEFFKLATKEPVTKPAKALLRARFANHCGVPKRSIDLNCRVDCGCIIGGSPFIAGCPEWDCKYQVELKLKSGGTFSAMMKDLDIKLSEIEAWRPDFSELLRLQELHDKKLQELYDKKTEKETVDCEYAVMYKVTAGELSETVWFKSVDDLIEYKNKVEGA